MTGKLMKNGTTTYVLVKDGEVIGNMENLSLKNCQAIKRGYDLEDLATDSADNYDASGNWHVAYELYKEGFQKALELMSDKKFSEEDIKDCWEKAFDVGYNFGHEQGDSTIANEDVDNYIQSLQQTEWDVEVEMIDYGIGNDEDGRPVIERKPLLDADGIQAIDDKFLEWFVKNPNCENVETKLVELNTDYRSDWKQKFKYKIIIPQEEPKQELHICKYCGAETNQLDDECYAKPKKETLEEVAERKIPASRNIWDLSETRRNDFKDGAKWQAERMFSEEDLINAYRWGTHVNHGTKEHFNEYLEQFKKK